LRYAIERLRAAAPAEPQDRGDIDDIALRSAERGERIARAEEGRAQIDGDDPLPIIRPRLLEALTAVDPGVVDEDIEPAERLRGFIDDALAFIDAREIARRRYRAIAHLKTLERLIDRFGARPVDRPPRAGIEKCRDCRLADPARPAGDQHF